MTRKFLSLVLLAAMAIAAGSMACVKTINDLDTQDETDSGT
ncbi:MAG TPA: hypothetical protein PKW35_15840 [Nannocystaceae bacterium]|nr:hypothetical protein [Nannocystaceae bacterium]